MNHHAESSYLLTEDLGEKITAFRHVGLETPSPSSQLFNEIQDELADALQAAIGDDHPVKRIKMRDLSDQIIGRIPKIWGNDVLVVSTCPEIGQPSKGDTIEINRLVDKYGQGIGLGPRPGHPSLAIQFAKIAADGRAADRQIVIAEDGMFKGETMRYVVEGLQAAKADVAGVVTGFTFGEAPVHDIVAHGVQVEVINDFGPILDWVPDHDFLPFTPGCGKVLGARVGTRLFPFYDHRHSSFSVPYIAPFGPVESWASIPAESINKFSTRCIELTIHLFRELEKLNGREIAIADIMPSRQRVSIPISLDVEGVHNGSGLPGNQSRVVTFLSESL